MHDFDSYRLLSIREPLRTCSCFLKSALIIALLISCSRPTLGAPIVLSYYWPVAHGGEFDSGRRALNAVTHIDVLAGHIQEDPRAYAYWRSRGVTILNRVYPFRVFDQRKGGHVRLTTYEDIYANFERNIKTADGISVDELLGGGRGDVVDPERRDIMIRLLRDIRRKYPEKLLVVWGSSEWARPNVPLLQAINRYCDFFVPQIYIPEREGRPDQFQRLGRDIDRLESQATGISKTTLIGLGLHEKMRSVGSTGFVNHIDDQLLHIFTDETLSKLPGVAFYAPNFVDHETILTLDARLGSMSKAGDQYKNH